MKNNLLLILMFCFGILLISSCKTDPKSETDAPLISKETTVTVRLRAEPDNLNPMLTTKGHATQVCEYLFPTLLNYDPYTLELSPVLVKSRPQIEVINEGDRKGWTKYYYEILDEAVWDDGSPVTGHDYAFTMKTLFNPHVGSGPYQPYLSLIKDIEIDADNPKNFTVYTDEKYIKAEYATGLFIYPKYKFDPDNIMDAYTYAEIRDPEKAEQHSKDEQLKAFGDQFNSPKYSRDPQFVGGCGAYKLEEWVEGERVVLVKKDNWWGDQLRDKYPMLTAYPKRIIFKPISDATTALTLTKNQELDVIASIPNDQFIEFKESEIGKESFDFYTPNTFVYNYYGLNTKRAKLSDKRVRKALAHLFDRDEVIKTINPFAKPIVGPFHPIRPYYNNDLNPIPLDVEKAKSLLLEAGWKDSNSNGTVDKMVDGELLEMELDLMITPNNKVSSSMGLIFQNEARKAGVRINIVEKDASTLFAQLRSRDFDIFALAAGSDLSIDDPYQYWHTDSDNPSGQNRFGFGNAETDQLINEIRTEMDENKRIDLFKKLQEIIYDEQPVIFLYVTDERIAVNKKFKGVKTTIKSPGYFVNYWYE